MSFTYRHPTTTYGASSPITKLGKHTYGTTDPVFTEPATGYTDSQKPQTPCTKDYNLWRSCVNSKQRTETYS